MLVILVLLSFCWLFVVVSWFGFVGVGSAAVLRIVVICCLGLWFG